MLQPRQRGSTSGGLSAFEELAAAGNPWRRTQPANSSAAPPAQLIGPVAGPIAVVPAAAKPGTVPTSPLQNVEAGHLTAQQPARRQEAGKELQIKPAAAVHRDKGGSIAAEWGSAQCIRASADLDVEGSSRNPGTFDGRTAAQQAEERPLAAALPAAQLPAPATAAGAGAQQQPAAVLTSTSMQLALRLRDYCELIRSVPCVKLDSPELPPCMRANTALNIRGSPHLSHASLACRVLSPAQHVFEGLRALFELFILHIFATFSGVRVAVLTADRPLARVSQMLRQPCWTTCPHVHESLSSRRIM